MRTISQLLVFILCVCTFTLSQTMIMGFTIYHKNNTNKKIKNISRSSSIADWLPRSQEYIRKIPPQQKQASLELLTRNFKEVISNWLFHTNPISKVVMYLKMVEINLLKPRRLSDINKVFLFYYFFCSLRLWLHR